MLEERDEGFISTEKIVEQPVEREEGPTSIDLTDRQISIGDAPAIVPQEQLQEQEQVQEKPKISKRKQKRRGVTSYLSNISKQVEKQENQINKVTMMVQSIQQERQKQTRSTKGVGARASQSPLQSIKQIRSQISQLQKQLTQIQNNIQKIRIASTSQVRFRKQSSTVMKPKSKKSKSSKASNRKKHKTK
jgi:hypothetical protein